MGLTREFIWQPQRDSNPCLHLQRVMSLATRRWGRAGSTQGCFLSSGGRTRTPTSLIRPRPVSPQESRYEPDSEQRPDYSMMPRPPPSASVCDHAATAGRSCSLQPLGNADRRAGLPFEAPRTRLAPRHQERSAPHMGPGRWRQVRDVPCSRPGGAWIPAPASASTVVSRAAAKRTRAVWESEVSRAATLGPLALPDR